MKSLEKISKKKYSGRNAIIVAGSIEKGQSEICKNVIRQFCTFVENAVVIDFYKGNKMRRLIGEEFDIIKYTFCKEDWLQEEESINEFLLDNNISSLFIFKTRMFKSFRYNDGSFAEKFVSSYKDNNEMNRSYVSTRKVLESVLFVNCSYNLGIKLFQLVIDPLEYDYRFVGIENIQRLYILKKNDMKYCPMYEIEMYKNCKVKQKELDMFFICTCNGEKRKLLIEVIIELKEFVDCKSSFVVEFVDNKENKNKKISQTEYYENVSKSKYTLVVQSYDATTFSIIRFFEAVCRNCVPLIWYEACLDDLKNTFEDIYDLVLKYNLIVSSKEEIVDRVNNYENDLNFINEVKNSKSFRKITNEKKVAKFYKKLLSK